MLKPERLKGLEKDHLLDVVNGLSLYLDCKWEVSYKVYSAVLHVDLSYFSKIVHGIAAHLGHAREEDAEANQEGKKLSVNFIFTFLKKADKKVRDDTRKQVAEIMEWNRPHGSAVVRKKVMKFLK